jgi:hypothetical protein
MSTFKDDLTNDLEIFLNSDEFAVDVTYLGNTIQGIFDDEFSSAVQGEMGVESTVPQVLLRTSDVPNVAHGETMTINSVVYQVIGIQPDGTGMTLILLSED